MPVLSWNQQNPIKSGKVDYGLEFCLKEVFECLRKDLTQFHSFHEPRVCTNNSILFTAWIEALSPHKTTVITKVKSQLDIVFSTCAISINLYIVEQISLGLLGKVSPHAETSILLSPPSPVLSCSGNNKWNMETEMSYYSRKPWAPVG